MILCIDAGNSLVKWGSAQNGQWVAQGRVAHADIPRLAERWQSFGVPQKVIISNVAGEKVRSALNVLFVRWRLNPDWVVASVAQCGVRNGYQQPAQLGSDRWAAMIAAWSRAHGACIVVGAGTALTADALSAEGEFIGGAIMPGYQLMLDALTRKIPQLATSAPAALRIFPTSTADAVQTGVRLALAGMVDRMRESLELRTAGPVACIVSGGGAEELRGLLPADTQLVDNLVLEGLLRIAQS